VHVDTLLETIKPVDRRRARSRIDQAKQQSNQSRFAGAVRPKQPEDFALRNLKGTLIQRSKLAETTKHTNLPRVNHFVITRKKQRTVTSRKRRMGWPNFFIELGVVKGHNLGLHLLVNSVQYFQQLRRSRVSVPICNWRRASHE